MAENLDDLEISTEDGLVFVMVRNYPDAVMFKPKWRDEGCGNVLTLKEISEQVDEMMPSHGTIMVMMESALHGDIYLCGNYEHGQWVRHGETRGYA